MPLAKLPAMPTTTALLTAAAATAAAAAAVAAAVAAAAVCLPFLVSHFPPTSPSFIFLQPSLFRFPTWMSFS
jgi:hypothetical protein